MSVRSSPGQRLSERLCLQERDTPADLRARVLEALYERGDGDAAVFSHFVEEDGRYEFASAQWKASEGISEKVAGCIAMVRQTAAPLASTLNVRGATPLERRAFIEDQAHISRRQFESSPAFDAYYRPNDLAYHQRLLAYHGDRFVGWVGLMRCGHTRPFGPRDRRRLRSFVEPVITALTQADRLERASAPSEPADLVVRPDGSVELATGTASAWLAVPGWKEALAAAVQRFDRGEPAGPALFGVARPRIARLDGDGGRVRYLVHVAVAAPLRLSPLAALSPVQREIAAQAAAGATVDEMARDLASRPETVKSHLKAVYRKLDVSSRVELSEVVRRCP